MSLNEIIINSFGDRITNEETIKTGSFQIMPTIEGFFGSCVTSFGCTAIFHELKDSYLQKIIHIFQKT